jgi:hypothetical protein
MKNLESEFLPYNLALRMKVIGFDEPCLAYYSILEIQRIGEHNLHYTQRGKEILRENDWSWVYRNFPKFRKYLKAEHCYKYSTNSSKLIASAPTYSQAFRWFRENWSLFPSYHFNPLSKKYRLDEIINVITGEIVWDSMFADNFDIVEFKTPEEAELFCLKKLIEIVEQKENEQNQ